MHFYRYCFLAIVLLLFLPPSTSALPLTDARTNNDSPSSNPDMEIIRARVIDDLLAPPVDDELITTLLRTIADDGSWPDIDYVDVSRTGFQHGQHLENMFQLSRSYKKRDSPWFQNPEVRNAALSALDFWLERDFICDNWWWNEMGTPGRMINTLLVLDKDLNEDQIRRGLRIAGRANLEASGARPGGDLIQIADMLGKQALFRRDETVLQRVLSVMADEIKVTTGRGLKPDMSFHHRVDNVICTLSYGLGYARSFANWAVRIAGTRYRFPDRAAQLLIDYFLDGICKSMVYGWYPDPGAKNRDLSRQGALRPAGPELAENLMKVSSYRRAELEKIVAIRKGLLQPDLEWNRYFWHSMYATHQRPGYFASVRMHSSRNHTMEQPHNEEGLKMHHVGDGSNFISVTGKEYLDIFPVWDWQKIPGTTVVQKPQHPHWKHIAKKGLTDFVGAASDGRYGAVATDFKSAHDPLRARKSWFFFDEEYVCLGAGITSEADYPVFTTLNQCRLNGDAVVNTDFGMKVLGKGRHSVSKVSWVWHDRVGYVFPSPENVEVAAAEARGTWREINHQQSTSSDTVGMDVFLLGMDHGIKPADSRYEYIVAPVAQPTYLDKYLKNSPLDILQNSESIQAVRHRQLERTFIVFYEPGKVEAAKHITVLAGSPCIVMMKTHGKSVEQLSVVDPTHKVSNIELRLSARLEGSGDGWNAEWDQKEKQSIIEVTFPREGYAGQTVVISPTGL